MPVFVLTEKLLITI